MTGFGRAESIGETYVVTVEARSVNHRHLDIALRLPKTLASLEADARKLIAARVERGRIDVQVQLGPAPGRADHQIVVDTALARQYVDRARALGEEVNLTGDVDLVWVLDRPGVFRVEAVEPPDAAAVWSDVATVLGRALEQLVAQRAAEGMALAGEMHALLRQLESEAARITERAPAAAVRREARLRERIRALVGDVHIDEARIVTEAATWAEKTDVAEELARLRSHVDQFRSILDKGGPLGRQLDFLIQELHREINTIGSKADDLEVSHAVLAAKGVIEKMREQAQNLE